MMIRDAMPDEKKRKYARVRFRRHAELDFQDKKYEDCRINDLSLTGMYVHGASPHQAGEQCVVKLFQKGSASELALRADAKVVRADESGVGIHFTAMSFDSYMFLQVTLLYEADEPMIIGLELPDECPFKIIDPTVEGAAE